jgi:hypothetical protein
VYGKLIVTVEDTGEVTVIVLALNLVANRVVVNDSVTVTVWNSVIVRDIVVFSLPSSE